MSHQPYVRPISRTTWWLKQPRYIRYMAREATCIFLYVYAILLAGGLKQLAAGPEAWAGFLEYIASPGWVMFHVVALVAALYHSYTWFILFPQTTPILVGEEFLPGKILIMAQFAVFIVATLIVLILGGVF